MLLKFSSSGHRQDYVNIKCQAERNISALAATSATLAKYLFGQDATQDERRHYSRPGGVLNKTPALNANSCNKYTRVSATAQSTAAGRTIVPN